MADAHVDMSVLVSDFPVIGFGAALGGERVGIEQQF